MFFKMWPLFLIQFLLTPLFVARADTTKAQETLDPAAPLPSITLRYDQIAKTSEPNNDRQSYNLGVTNPFIMWHQLNVMTLSIPYNSGEDVPSGAGSTLFSNLFIFNRPWGKFGFGINSSFNSPSQGREGAQSGPSFGAVYHSSDHCRWGAINANYLGKQISTATLQIIAACAFSNGWSLSSGNMLIRYDLLTHEFIDVPISFQISKAVLIKKQPINFFFNPRYNFEAAPNMAHWIFSIGITMVANPFDN